ncbi:hypothetical protein FGADI_7795 [Fusarium gaditjirri]|uniref:Uncharacterized protein n=1 Tax=Fusarium gaditjirri TaxID=282569 RepID=A0A8H4T492_9HYPO|nr:hypothetical protein FGADI_7795 [Fusarium gaditjirri]
MATDKDMTYYSIQSLSEMAAYCYEPNTQDVLCDGPVEYCSCVSMVDNYQVPYHDRRCGICHRHCPDEKAIYLALKGIKSIGELGEAWARKTKHRSSTVPRALALIQDHPNVSLLFDKYGTEAVHSVVKRLLKNRVFTSESIAQKRFPGLTIAIAEEEAISTEPTEVTGEKLDWELLVAAETPAKAPEEELEEATAKTPEEEPEEATAKPTEEDCIEDQRWPEKEPFTTEVYPAEAYEAPAETKPPEVEEACGDRVQEEQNAICLPLSSQHKLIVYLQEVLETACFAYGQKQLATQLRKRGWDCVEAVALHTWMNEFPAITEAFNTKHRRELLQSVVDIQDIAVKRTRIDWSRMKKLLDDALELTEVLNVKEYSDMVQEARIDIGKAVEGLSYKEQEAEDQQEEKLQRIAEERRKLDKCEVEVRKYKENRTKDYRKWAESEIEGILEERRKTLKTARYFIKLIE